MHHADAVGDRHRLLLVVGHDHEGQAEPLLEMHQLELGLAAQLLVERGERLVEQQHARTLDQRARQRHPLALAAGQLVRLARGETFELDQRQHLGDARRDLGLGQSILLEPERDIALDGQVRKQRVALEHHVDRPPIGRHRRDIVPVEQDAARIRRLEAGEQAQQRGLAAARGAEQREEFALENVERHGVDRGRAGEPFAHALEPHQRPRRRVAPGRESSARSDALVRVVLTAPHCATLARHAGFRRIARTSR